MRAEAVDRLVTNGGDELLRNTENESPTHIEMQHMIELALHVVQETTLDHHIKAMVKTKVVIIVDTANYEAVKGKNMPIYQLLK